MSAQIRGRSDARKVGLVTSVRFQCVEMTATPSMDFAQSLENVGVILGTVGLDAESVRNYPDANMGTVPRALNADVKKAGLAPFALSQHVQKSARQEDVDIVQRQEFALAARVGKGKAARNVLLRKDVGMVLVPVLETAFVSLVGEGHSVIRQNASSVLKVIASSLGSAAAELVGLERGVTSVWLILGA